MGRAGQAYDAGELSNSPDRAQLCCRIRDLRGGSCSLNQATGILDPGRVREVHHTRADECECERCTKILIANVPCTSE